MDLDAAFINYSKNESARNIMSKCTNHHPFFLRRISKGALLRGRFRATLCTVESHQSGH